MKTLKGYKFKTTAVWSDRWGGHYEHFGMRRDCSYLAGVPSESVETVECVVTEKDLVVDDMLKDPQYDNTKVDYLGYYDFKEERFSLIFPNIYQFQVCFFEGADDACFRDGNRIGSVCRLEVKKPAKK